MSAGIDERHAVHRARRIRAAKMLHTKLVAVTQQLQEANALIAQLLHAYDV